MKRRVFRILAASLLCSGASLILAQPPEPPRVLRILRVRPGHAADFAEMRRLLNAAFDKTSSKQRRVVYSVTSGAPAGTYLIISAMESLKAMDPVPGTMSMADAFGSAQERYQKLQAEIVISAENTMFSIDPKMSNPSKEFITADPDF